MSNSLVVASAVNENDGEAIYPVKWNDDFMGLPVIEDQRQPTFNFDEVETIVSKAEGQDRLLYALLAGPGLRVGAALALQAET